MEEHAQLAQGEYNDSVATFSSDSSELDEEANVMKKIMFQQKVQLLQLPFL